MAFSDCCLKGFDWDGTPSGSVGTLADNKAYIVGDNKDLAILHIADGFGYTYNNNRLLCDHYAREAQATVYLPDFFGGAVLDSKLLEAGRFGDLPMAEFAKLNSKEARRPEMVACARALKSQYKRVIAVGFCYGGWGAFQLGAKGEGLVDAISVGHPSWLTKEEIDNVGVPVQLLAPEIDPVFTPELREYAFAKLKELNFPFSYEHFPGVDHGFATRGDGKDKAIGRALERAKNSVVMWAKQWGHDAE